MYQIAEASSPAAAHTMQPPVFQEAAPYRGPERRRQARPDALPWLTGMLDEVDYGMVLVQADGRVAWLNHAAQQELEDTHPLQLTHGTLGVHNAVDVAPLFDALAAAQRGLRRMLTVGRGTQQVTVSVVPLRDPLGSGMGGGMSGTTPCMTLLMLGKREVCAQLSVQAFARHYRLTSSEETVLGLLCAGVRPAQIAAQRVVRISTVRTQIGSIRGKTGAATIRDLVKQVAMLPPSMCALRTGSQGARSRGMLPASEAQAAAHS